MNLSRRSLLAIKVTSCRGLSRVSTLACAISLVRRWVRWLGVPVLIQKWNGRTGVKLLTTMLVVLDGESLITEESWEMRSSNAPWNGVVTGSFWYTISF